MYQKRVQKIYKQTMTQNSAIEQIIVLKQSARAHNFIMAFLKLILFENKELLVITQHSLSIITSINQYIA